jgi:hypothetical protein
MKKHSNNLFALIVFCSGLFLVSNAEARSRYRRERHPDLRLAVDIVSTLLYATTPKTVVVAPEPARTVVVTERVCQPPTVVYSDSYYSAPVVYQQPAPVVYSCPAPVLYRRPAPVHRRTYAGPSGRGHGGRVSVRPR